MKLIIDIPEEQYNDIVKYLTDNDGNYAYSDFNLRGIIRNGTPYNPTGDAISREALKKELDEQNEQIAWEQGYEVQSRFCPNCGAKMKGGAE